MCQSLHFLPGKALSISKASSGAVFSPGDASQTLKEESESLGKDKDVQGTFLRAFNPCNSVPSFHVNLQPAVPFPEVLKKKQTANRPNQNIRINPDGEKKQNTEEITLEEKIDNTLLTPSKTF